MATLTPTLTLASTDAFANQPTNLSVTIGSPISAPMADVSRAATNDAGRYGAGIVIADEDTNTYFVYIKHLDILASDFTTAAHATNDFIVLSNADDDASSRMIKLFPGEFAFFPLSPADGTDSGLEVGGLKVTKGGADVVYEYAYFKRG